MPLSKVNFDDSPYHRSLTYEIQVNVVTRLKESFGSTYHIIEAGGEFLLTEYDVYDNIGALQPLDEFVATISMGD